MDSLQRNIIARSEFRFRSDGSRFTEDQPDFHRDLQSKLSGMDFNRTGRLLFFHGRRAAVRYTGPGSLFVHHKPRCI